MGGLLAADSLLELARPYRKGKAASLWPRIVACLSFDTPVSYSYFSSQAHPNVVSTVPGAAAFGFQKQRHKGG